MDKQRFGKIGEQLALKFLKDKDYAILETNFRKRSGEIDIIARAPGGELVFCEVKTRHDSDFGYPEEAVDSRKIRKILLTAQMWLTMKKAETENYRIDVIAIEIKGGKPHITHLENVS